MRYENGNTDAEYLQSSCLLLDSNALNMIWDKFLFLAKRQLIVVGKTRVNMNEHDLGQVEDKSAHSNWTQPCRAQKGALFAPQWVVVHTMCMGYGKMRRWVVTLRPTLEYIFAHIVAPQQLLDFAQFAHIGGIQHRLLFLLAGRRCRCRCGSRG